MGDGSELIVVYGDPVTPELARTLDIGGYHWQGVRTLDEAHRYAPDDGWRAAVIELGAITETAWSLARALRQHEIATPILVLINGTQLTDLELRDELFDDFCITPFHPAELETRLRHLMWHGVEASPTAGRMVEHGPLVLDLDTYQATIAGRPLDLTYMEYELLKFLAQHPGKVFTREILLSRVWGYEYYGGARTVDVHVRRLRAKLGAEHAKLIATVRSVGYRFGQSRWGA